MADLGQFYFRLPRELLEAFCEGCGSMLQTSQGDTAGLTLWDALFRAFPKPLCNMQGKPGKAKL